MATVCSKRPSARLRAVDLAHASLPQPLLELIGAQPLADPPCGCARRQQVDDRSFDEVADVILHLEVAHDLGSQIGISPASVVEVGVSLAGLESECLEEDGLRLLPTFDRHGSRSRLARRDRIGRSIGGACSGGRGGPPEVDQPEARALPSSAGWVSLR